MEEVIQADVRRDQQQEAFVAPRFLLVKVLNESKQHGLTAVVVLCVERVLGEEVLRFGTGAAAKRHEFVEVLKHRAVLALVACNSGIPKLGRAANVVGRGWVVHHAGCEVGGLIFLSKEVVTAHLADRGFQSVGLEHGHSLEGFVVPQGCTVVAGIPRDGGGTQGRRLGEFPDRHGQDGHVCRIGFFWVSLFKLAVAFVELGLRDVAACGILPDVLLKAWQCVLTAVLQSEVGGRFKDALLDFVAIEAHGRGQVVEQATANEQGLHDVVGVGRHVVVPVVVADAIPQDEHFVFLSLLHADQTQFHQGLLGPWRGAKIVDKAEELGLGLVQFVAFNVGPSRLEQGLHHQTAVRVVLEELVQSGQLSGQVFIEFGGHGPLEQGVIEGLDATRQHAVVELRGLVKGLEGVEAVCRPEFGIAHAGWIVIGVGLQVRPECRQGIRVLFALVVGVAAGVVRVVVQFAEVTARGRAEFGEGRCSAQIVSLVVENLTFPIERLRVQLGVDVVGPRAIEESQCLRELVVLEELHRAVEGKQLRRGAHGFVGIGDVVQCFKGTLVVAAGHVDLQQEAIGFITPRRRGELLEVGLESHNRIVKRVERKFVGQLGVVEEGVLLDVKVKLRRGSCLEGLLGPCTVAHFEVAIGHVVGGVLGEFIFAVRRKRKAVEGTAPVAKAVTHVAHLVGKLGVAARTICAVPSQFEVGRRRVVGFVTVPRIAEQVRHLGHTFIVEATGFVQQWRRVFFQSVPQSQSVVQLGDVQGHQLLEVGVIGNLLEPIQGHLGLSFEVSDVREVVLGSRLEIAFDFEHFVERDTRFLVFLTFEVTMSQLESILVSTGLVQLSDADLVELFRCSGIVLALVVVVGQLPTRLQGEGTLGELLHERLHAVDGVAVVQCQRTHGRVVVGLDVGVAGFASGRGHQRLEVVKCQGVLLVFVGLHSPLVCHVRRISGVRPLGQTCHGGQGNNPQEGCARKESKHGVHGFARVPSKLPSPTAVMGREEGWFSTRFRADFALEMNASSQKMGGALRVPGADEKAGTVGNQSQSTQRNSVRRLTRRPSGVVLVVLGCDSP